jgi:chromosomal replication initiation ATPase DnaA
MNVPSNFSVETREVIEIHTMLQLYLAQYGSNAVREYLKRVPLKIHKKNGKHLGHYIEAKVCEEFEITPYELYESNKRKEVSEARQILCVLCEKHLDISRTDISELFHRSRHLAKRLITDFHKKLAVYNEENSNFLMRYKKLDSIITAYIEFQPAKKSKS